MEKKKRITALSNFTRANNIFKSLIADKASAVLVTPQFQKVNSYWEKLEVAHDEFIEATDLDNIETDKDGMLYMEAPGEEYAATVRVYSTFLNGAAEKEDYDQRRMADEDRAKEVDARKCMQAEKKEAELQLSQEKLKAVFDSAHAELDSSIDSFNRLSLTLVDTLAEASDADKRSEWKRYEADFHSLKDQLTKLHGIDHSQDCTVISNKFVETETVFTEIQKFMLKAMKETSLTSGGVRQNVGLATKKEAVCLPSFEGVEEKSPYLKFPIWKRQWEVLIVEYNEQYRANLLYQHVDDAARSKFVGFECDYAKAFACLEAFFGDPMKVVRCVMSEVMSQTIIADGDYKSLVKYSLLLNNNYNRLSNLDLEHEISNTAAMLSIIRKFPLATGEKWIEYLSSQLPNIRSKPFPTLVKWLDSQRVIWEQMDNVCIDTDVDNSVNSFYGSEKKRCYICSSEDHLRNNCPLNKDDRTKKPRKPPQVKKHWCALHKDLDRQCFSNNCQELRKMTDANQRIQLLKDNGDCFHCLGDHKAEDCLKKDRVCGGGKDGRGCSRGHTVHELLCFDAKCFSIQQTYSTAGEDEANRGVVLSIMRVQGSKNGTFATVFWDLGSTSNFVREDYAKRCGFKGRSQRLSVTTLGGVTTEFRNVTTYRCSIKDEDGISENFEAFGLESITGAISKINSSSIKSLFPHLTEKMVQQLTRVGDVDFLIGMKHPSWHPERAEKARDGDLWLFRGRFGSCIAGRHPSIYDETVMSNSLFVVNMFVAQVNHRENVPHELEFCINRGRDYSDPGPNAFVHSDSVADPNCRDIVFSDAGSHSFNLVNHCDSDPGPHDCNVVMESCHVTKSCLLDNENRFFECESLGTIVEPKCGGCRCSKCPVPGSRYSFKEQSEYDIIQKNLFYDDGKKCWYTEYPWNCNRNVLPRNEKIALQSLITLERNLSKKPDLAEDFCNQIDEMVARGSAIVLTEEEISSWEGDYYYLPILGVKSKKKWLRVVFDASRRQGGYPSMNDCLHKGPDRFVNNLLSVVLGFRNGRVGCAADIKKFHNRVRLVEKDVHMQRFLWRAMNTDTTPKTYAVLCNNFGVKPANCVATSAYHKSADAFADIYPIECQEIKDQTYVDDQLIAAENLSEAKLKTKRIDEIGEHASMPNKGWTYSGDRSSSVSIGGDVLELEDRVLGLLWDVECDMFRFTIELDLKDKDENGKLIDVKVTTEEEFSKLVDPVVTRRLMSSNVARIFDPCGWWCPVILESKLLMRQSWCDNFGWDDPLPLDLSTSWLNFLKSLLSLETVCFPRSLWPEEEVIGLPMLIVFSDGSVSAFGAVAYIRWKLASGGYWSCLIMAKSKIAPKYILSIPRMELNGAVLGVRIKNFLLKETNFEFSKIWHLVDSSTVLGYVHKESGAFGPFEGIRISEVQTSSEFVDGKLVGWAWVPGCENPADWCTKPRNLKDMLATDGFWKKGPDFLSREENTWPIKLSYKKENLEGELNVVRRARCAHAQVKEQQGIMERLVNRCGTWRKLVRIMAWMRRFVMLNSLSSVLNAEELSRAKKMLVKYAQLGLYPELQKAAQSGLGKFRKLAPVLDDESVWRVGSRMKVALFTVDAKLPALIPVDHRITLLLMRHVHQISHPGQDGTLCRFRGQGYWAVKAGNLAKKVKNDCVTCRKLAQQLLCQPMGGIPAERLSQLIAWSHCQIDLFGPFSCRSDVNARATKKIWGMVIEDMNSGAVYLDIVQDYSSPAVLLTLRRFGSMRGWPGVMYSDPGSQLESAGGKLEQWWTKMEDALRTFAASKNFKWLLSPADSPWRQGKAERRIAIVKKLIRISIGDTRVTPVELQTIFFEESNICNERPISLSLPRSDGTYTIITPNQLLLGRSFNQLPDDLELVESLPISARYRLVNHVTTEFWKRWSSEVSPGLVVRQKWHEKSRNLCEGDLVMICEPSKLKSRYKLAVVDYVHDTRDGCVRSVTLRYTNIRKDAKGALRSSVVRVTRSIQRLVLVLPVEEQVTKIEVQDDDHSVHCLVQS